MHNPADNIALGRVINVPPCHIGDKTIATLATWSGELGVSMVGGLALAAGDLKSPALSVEGWHTTSPQMTLRKPSPLEHPFAAAAQKSLIAFYRVLAVYRGEGRLDGVGSARPHRRGVGLCHLAARRAQEGEDRRSNLQELRTVAADYDDFPPELRLTAFLEEVALVSDQDQLAEEADRVTLLTLHTAKGLEFPVVFIVGLEEKISRTAQPGRPRPDEEERRLMYVGVNVVKDRLYLVRAFGDDLGTERGDEPSRFLCDEGGWGRRCGGAGERFCGRRGAEERFAKRGGAMGAAREGLRCCGAPEAPP